MSIGALLSSLLTFLIALVPLPTDPEGPAAYIEFNALLKILGGLGRSLKKNVDDQFLKLLLFQYHSIELTSTISRSELPSSSSDVLLLLLKP